jgi:hypothetical protein
MTRASQFFLTVALAGVAACVVVLGIVKTRSERSPEAGGGGLVGRVPVAELARIIVETEAPPPPPDGSHTDGGLLHVAPFVLVVNPLHMPSEPARVTCNWSSAQAMGSDAGTSGAARWSLGRLQSYGVVAQDDESRKIGTWMRNGKEVARQDAKSSSDYFIEFELHPDADNIEKVVRIDEQLVPHLASKSTVIEFGRYRTYYVASLCRDGDEEAYLVESQSEAGRGLLCVMRFDGARWEAIGCEETWIT